MRRFGKITIVGVGLIGGSIGLAVKKRGVAKEVVGVCRRRSSLAKAIARHAVDWGTRDVEKGVSGADIVIIATNVGTIPARARAASRYMKKGSILTDVGSVKAPLVREIEGFLPEGISFVGSHPMAGSEKAGVESARADLFEGAVTILTKTPRTDPEPFHVLARLWTSLGADVAVMTPALHDEKVALVSHMPHVAAMGVCLAQDGTSLAYAANGFKDTTRIASSDPEMWTDILRANRAAVLKGLDKLIVRLTALKESIARRDFDRLRAYMRRAKQLRDSV